jgi:hypothetical protein
MFSFCRSIHTPIYIRQERNVSSSCFHISLWNFEKVEFVQTAYGC